MNITPDTNIRLLKCPIKLDNFTLIVDNLENKDNITEATNALETSQKKKAKKIKKSIAKKNPAEYEQLTKEYFENADKKGQRDLFRL